MHLVRGEVDKDVGTATWKQAAAIYRCGLNEMSRFSPESDIGGDELGQFRGLALPYRIP